jgi:hypothetical protein
MVSKSMKGHGSQLPLRGRAADFGHISVKILKEKETGMTLYFRMAELHLELHLCRMVDKIDKSKTEKGASKIIF